MNGTVPTPSPASSSPATRPTRAPDTAPRAAPAAARQAGAPRPSRWQARLGDRAKGVAGVAVALALWELARRTGWLDPRDFPATATILAGLAEALGDGSLVAAISDTLAGWAVGVAIAIVIGVPAGFLIGLSPAAERTTRPLVEFMRPIPSVALIPIAIIWLGLGFRMKVFLIAFASLWPVLFNTKTGVAAVDIRYLETGRILGLERRALLWRVVLPAALPSIATGIRIAASIGLVLAITAEMVVGRVGLGFWLESSRMSGRVGDVWGAILVSGCLGYGLSAVLRAIEARLLHWSLAYRVAP